MKKQDLVNAILGERCSLAACRDQGRAFAPTNIALCKYWGKRDAELNLPQTSSLSISLGDKGALCQLRPRAQSDSFSLNGQSMALVSPFGQRLKAFLDLFRIKHDFYFQVDMQMNIPYAAGLASSACGFASLVLALNDLLAWGLESRALSILARLGSGSACRSVVPGFVEWRAGSSADGMDSYAERLDENWPTLCIGLLIVSEREKPLASRLAMERTVATSALYSAWPEKVRADLHCLKKAIKEQDFRLLGETAESNALNMHALMLSAWPPISYALPETLTAMQSVWKLREQGLLVYFTQDAGPNLKLLFQAQDREQVSAAFPSAEIIQPQLIE